MATVSQPAREDAPWRTHTVANQPPPLVGLDVFASNLPLVEATEREGAGWIAERASALGRFVGEAGGPQQVWGRLANEHKPVLHTHDRYGNRIDEVEFHPAWHQLMKMGVEHELHSLPWTSDEPAAHAARAAIYMTGMQAEAGYACPITMTFAVVPALRAQPELAAEWEPLVTATTYDPRSIPAAEKGSAIAGMAMTEKQGGSDVRANTTYARPLNGGGAGAEYQLTGHKWFCSAPMSDIFLVLAQAESADGSAEGLSCFLMPRILPDGTRNAMHIQRLKDKLGNRSNASSEIELHNAWAQMVGEPGRGVPTIIEMVGHTRLDCVIGAAAGMRAAVVQATHHAAHRAAFGKTLIDQPLMRNVLADLCLESEAATALAMRLARAYDEAGNDAREGNDDSDAQLFKRVATAVGKYWACKRAPNHAFEAMECLGRQRLRRGLRDAAPVPRGAADLDLGGLGQRDQPRRAARALALAALAGGVPRRGLAGPGADARLDAHVRDAEGRCSTRTPPRSSRARGAWSKAWPWRCRARCSCGALRRPWPTPSAPRASAAMGAWSTARCRAGSDFETIIERSRPQV